MARDPVYKNKTRLRQILDYQESQGQGKIRAGAMTLLKRGRERFSPLQGLEGSFIAGLLPFLSPYKATPRRSTAPSGGSGGSGALGTQEIVNKISELGDSFDRVLQKTIDTSIHTKNVAKHTSLIPRMASDTNITRKNISKIAKVLGAKPTDKADRYFQNFDVREREYESKFRKERGKVKDTGTVSKTGKEDKKGGILSNLLGVVGKGLGLASLGAGIGGFLYGISFGIGSLNKMGGATGLKDLLVNLAEGLKAFDAQGLAIMGTLLVGGALFGRYAGGPLGIKTIGAGLGITAIGAGIGGFMAAMSQAATFSGDNGRSAKELMTNIAEGFKAFDVSSMIAMGALIGAGGLFGAYEGGKLAGGDLKALGEFGGAVLGITAIGLGIGGFMAAMSQAATFSGDNGKSAGELLSNIATGLNAFDTTSLIAMGALIGAGGLFGAYEGGKLAGGDKKALGEFGGAVLGITAIGLGIGGFMAALSGAASLSGDKGETAKTIMQNFAEGMNALGGVNMAVLGGIMALGGAAGAFAGLTATSSGGMSLIVAAGAVGGIAGVGAAIGLFLAALSGAASLSKDKGEAARDILVNLATGLNAFGAINGDNIMKLGSGFKALGEGLGSLFAQDIFDRIRKYFTGSSAKDTFTSLAENLKLLEKVNGTNLFNLGNGLNHLSIGLKNLASLTKADLENINKALNTSTNVPQNVTVPSVPSVPKTEAKPVPKTEAKPEATVPTKVPSLDEQDRITKLAGNAYSTLVNAKRPQAEIDAALKNFEAQTRKLEEMKQSAVPGKAERVESKTDGATKSYAEKVGQRESSGNYNTTFGKAGNASINGKPITENTVAEVIAWQEEMRKTGKNIHAAGKYGIMNVAAGAKLANIPLDAKFDADTQEKMMVAYTKENARILTNYGIEPTESNLALAHAVGPRGLRDLLNAQNQGKGNAIVADVLGLEGNARKTNPHLAKLTVDEYIAQMRKSHGNEKPSVLAQGPETTLPKQESPTKQESKSVLSSIFDKVKSGTSGLFGMMNMENLKNMIPEFLKDADFSAAEYGGDLRDYVFGKNAPIFKKLSQFQEDVGSPEKIKKFLDNITGVAKISGDDLSGLSEMLTQNKEEMMMRSGQENEVVKSPINIPTAIPDNTTASTAWAPVVNTDHMGYFMKWQSTSYALI